MDIFLIDAIGPFFRDYKKNTINWSKIPFDHLDPDDPEQSHIRFARIGSELDLFCGRIAAIGYNSISLDDVAHLTPHPWLEPEINERLGRLQEAYRHLFAVCSSHGLRVFLTMDMLTLSPAVRRRIGGKQDQARLFAKDLVESALTTFPELGGIIIRIGESDGSDIGGSFRSELLLRTAAQANRMLHTLLPVFAHHQRLLILRNWTVGAYQIGDLLWHRRTTARVLRGIDSPWFILSMKYGESDFFRYLPINKNFFHLPVRKIIELQARREYEGAGEYPSFIGWDYQEYAQQLAGVEQMAGISVWCQTGGWLPFRRLSFLDREGLWNELNAYVTIKIFRYHWSVEQAVESFAGRIGCSDAGDLLELLRLNDQVIKELLYMKEVAGRTLFFRRIRIPPLLSVYWNTIFINHPMRQILRVLVPSGEVCVTSGYQALKKVEKMRQIAVRIGLPDEDLRFMYDTFSLLALAREYYFLPYDDTIRIRLKLAKKIYKKRYPRQIRPRYRLKTDYSPTAWRRTHLRWLFRVFFRERRTYRIVDHLITLHFTFVFFRLIFRARIGGVPKFARKRAMGIETILR